MDQRQKILLSAYIHASQRLMLYLIILLCSVIVFNSFAMFLLQNPDFLLGAWGKAILLPVILIIFLLLTLGARKEFQEKMTKYQGHLFKMTECPVCKEELFLGKCWKKCGVQWEIPEEEEE